MLWRTQDALITANKGAFLVRPFTSNFRQKSLCIQVHSPESVQQIIFSILTWESWKAYNVISTLLGTIERRVGGRKRSVHGMLGVLSGKKLFFKALKSLRCGSGALFCPPFSKHLSSSSGCLLALAMPPAPRCPFDDWIHFWPCCKLPVWLHRQPPPLVPLCCSPKALHEHHYYPCKLAQLTQPCCSSLFVNPSFFTVSGPRTKKERREAGFPLPLSSPSTSVPTDRNPCEY